MASLRSCAACNGKCCHEFYVNAFFDASPKKHTQQQGPLLNSCSIPHLASYSASQLTDLCCLQWPGKLQVDSPFVAPPEGKIWRRMLPFQLDSPFCAQGKIMRRKWSLQLDSSFCGQCGVKFREGSGHAELTHPFVGHAGVKLREGCCHFNLTHPFVGHAGVKFREGCCPSKLTHPLVSHPRVKL